VITFNYKDDAKTVTLAELEFAQSEAGEATGTDGAAAAPTTGKVLNFNDFRCSHLDGSAPPL